LTNAALYDFNLFIIMWTCLVLFLTLIAPNVMILINPAHGISWNALHSSLVAAVSIPIFIFVQKKIQNQKDRSDYRLLILYSIGLLIGHGSFLICSFLVESQRFVIEIISEFSFLLSRFFLLCFMWRRIFRNPINCLNLRFIVLISGIHTYINVTYYLIPLFLNSQFPLFYWVNSSLYSIVSVLCFSIAVTASARVNRWVDHWFLQTVVFLEIVDLAIRYQSAQIEYYRYHWAYSLWTFGIGGILAVGILNKKPGQLLSENAFISSYNSSRVKTALVSGLWAIIAISGVLVLLQTPVNDAFNLTKILILAYIIWLLSNIRSILETKDFVKVNKQILEAIGKLNTNGLIAPISNRTSLLETDELIDGFNNLVLTQSEKSEQVLHDLGSPLLTLKSIEQLHSLPSEARAILQGLSDRIQGIIQTLPRKQRKQRKQTPVNEVITNDDIPSPKPLVTLVDSIVIEKRTQYRHIAGLRFVWNPDDSHYVVFYKEQVIELQRILSNLIDNAVHAIEAISNFGTVSIQVTGGSGVVQIQIKDTGKGIPPENLPRVWDRGFTLGKRNGSGFGLSHVGSTLISWGGSHSIQSEVGKGTVVTLQIPNKIQLNQTYIID